MYPTIKAGEPGKYSGSIGFSSLDANVRIPIIIQGIYSKEETANIALRIEKLWNKYRDIKTEDL